MKTEECMRADKAKKEKREGGRAKRRTSHNLVVVVAIHQATTPSTTKLESLDDGQRANREMEAGGSGQVEKGESVREEGAAAGPLL